MGMKRDFQIKHFAVLNTHISTHKMPFLIHSDIFYKKKAFSLLLVSGEVLNLNFVLIPIFDQFTK